MLEVWDRSGNFKKIYFMVSIKKFNSLNIFFYFIIKFNGLVLSENFLILEVFFFNYMYMLCLYSVLLKNNW